MSRRFATPLLKSLLLAVPVAGLILAGGPAAGAGVIAARSPQVSTWDGYVDTNSAGNTYSEASANWTQPKITCTSSSGSAAFWVGLDGYSSATVEQAGIEATCESGSATYFSWWEMYPGNAHVVGETVKAGDKISVLVSRRGTTYTLEVTDATHPANSFTVAQTCAACTDSSAEWIEEPVSSPLLVGSWTVTGATVKSGSTTGVIATFPHVALGTAGPLNAAGNGFTVP